jgi:acetylornithine/N-succinyldiaminopimelate aminotransferase
MAEMAFMDTYARTGIVLERGKGAYLWDKTGKRYVDFFAGIAVSSLGHGHPALASAIAEQAGKLIHACNYFETEVANRFARRLCVAAGMARVFLANSGCEANEGAIKLARKWARQKWGDKAVGMEILVLEDSFHGRTITTLAATAQEKFHRWYDPFTPGFRAIPRGDIAALRSALASGQVLGLMLEPIQGEGGVNIIGADYITEARKLTQDAGALLILDEIQTGVGRTGSFLAAQSLGVKADIVSLAKGIAGGLPCGAFLCAEALAPVFEAGDHGTTFGGNPVAAAAGNVVLDVVTAPGFLDSVVRKGKRIMDRVTTWKSPIVREVRGKGLMIGIDVTADPHRVMEAGLDRGVIVLTAGQSVVRIVPPLVIDDSEIDEGLTALKGAFEACAG